MKEFSKDRSEIIRLDHISKSFGKTRANDDISLSIYRGEVLSILGENGSGKSSLMNIIAGIYYPDQGRIFINGQEVEIRSPKDAFNYKIGMIHQHFKLIDIFTATENIILGLKDATAYNVKESSEKIREICSKYGFRLNPDKKVYDMSVSEKQMVEVVKVLYRGADVLILDEPTAVLTPQEIRNLFSILRRMRDAGKAIVIITHKLQEVMALSDRVAVLHKGRMVKTVETAKTSESELTELMVGHEMDLNIERPRVAGGETRLKVKHLDIKDQQGRTILHNVNFSVKAGEILGIAGLSGSGQKELLEAIAGLQKVRRGQIDYLDPNSGEKKNLCDLSPSKIKNLGVRLSFVPEDRLGMGLVGNMDLVDNMLLRSFDRSGPILNRKAPRKLAEKLVSSLNISTPSVSTPLRQLSGGNIQKVLLGREMSNSPALLMTAYPVRGLDINSSYQIYDLLNKEKKEGVAIIFVGEDLDVMLELCDRILVLSDGTVSGLVDAEKSDKEEIGLLMTQTQTFMKQYDSLSADTGSDLSEDLTSKLEKVAATGSVKGAGEDMRKEDLNGED